MKRLAAALAVLLAAPASARSGFSAEARVRALASQSGLVVPAGLTPAAIPAVKAAPVRWAAAAPIYGQHVSGSGFVHGGAWLNCPWPVPGDIRPAPDARISESVSLSGSMLISGADGSQGQALVTGTVQLSGTCRGGSAFVSGSGNLTGTANLSINGTRVGTAHVSGSVMIHRSVGSGYTSFNEYVSVSGTLSPY